MIDHPEREWNSKSNDGLLVSRAPPRSSLLLLVRQCLVVSVELPMSATATATATAPQSTAAPADPASPSTTTSADAATAAETPEHHSSNGTPGVSAATSDSSAAAAAAEPAANEDGDGDGDAGDEIIDDAEMREMDALLKDLEANSEPDEPPLAAAAAADDDAAAASATTSSTSSAAAASAPAVTSMTENLAALIENMKQLAGTRRRCVRLYGIAAADRPTEQVRSLARRRRARWRDGAFLTRVCSQEVLEFVAPALNVPVDTAGIKVVFPDERKGMRVS